MSGLDGFPDPDVEIEFDEEEDEARAGGDTAAAIVEALQEYGVKDVRALGQVAGTTATLYEFEVDGGTPMGAIAAKERDLAYALSATYVKITAPLPGRRAFGVEVPDRRGDDHAPAIELQDGADPPAPEPHYATLTQFVESYLFPLYRRQIGGGNNTVKWCREWWRHGEAVTRLDALWRAWEFLRLDPGTGMSVWMRDHLDVHMGVLLSEHGPFEKCTIGDERKGEEPAHVELSQLSSAEIPAGLFDPD